MSMGRRGEIFIKNREKIQELQEDLSHIMVKNRISLEFLTHLQKADPKGFI